MANDPPPFPLVAHSPVRCVPPGESRHRQPDGTRGLGSVKIVGVAGSRTGSRAAVQTDRHGGGAPEVLIGSPGVGEAVSVVHADASCQPYPAVHGTSGTT